jgi:hypothetical protein
MENNNHNEDSHLNLDRRIHYKSHSSEFYRNAIIDEHKTWGKIIDHIHFALTGEHIKEHSSVDDSMRAAEETMNKLQGWDIKPQEKQPQESMNEFNKRVDIEQYKKWMKACDFGEFQLVKNVTNGK